MTSQDEEQTSTITTRAMSRALQLHSPTQNLNIPSQITTDPLTPTVTFYCLVHGDDPNEAFEVKAAKSETIANVKKLVKKEKEPEFNKLATTKFTLWRLDIPKDVLATLSTDFEFKTKGKKLSPLSNIGEVFTDDPAEAHVHIIVEAPSVLKRVATETMMPGQVDKPLGMARPSTSPSRTTTPSIEFKDSIRTTTSSVFSSTETRSSMDSILKGEIEGTIFEQIEDFIPTFFPDKLVSATSVKNIFRKCIQKNLYGNGRWHVNDDPLPEISTIHHESEMYPVYELANILINIGAPKSTRIWLDHSTSHLLGAVARRKPDGIGVETDKSTKPVSWGDVDFAVEIKRDQDPREQFASYVREVFGAQPNRRYVLGISLRYYKMTVWLFDRAGAISSIPFDIHEEPESFILVVVGLAKMSRSELGYDPTISKSSTGSFVITAKNEKFIVDKIIFHRPVVNGRGTVICKAHKGNRDGMAFVIKDAWRPVIRKPEGELLQLIANKIAWDDNRSFVARYYHHEDLGTVYDDVRRGLDAHQSVNDNRIHSRIVMETVGDPIWTFRTPLELIRALRDAIVGHRRMHDEAGILHGDISLYNILIEPIHRHGFLIDLDYAFDLNDARKPGEKFRRTGTLPFLSIGVLGGESHTYRDDLESFFYVFIWICCEWEGGKWRVRDRKIPAKQGLLVWSRGDMRTIAGVKLIMMTRYFENDVLSQCSSEPLKDFARQFHRVLFPERSGGGGREVAGDVGYHEVEMVFNAWIEEKEVEGLGEQLESSVKL